MSDEDAANPVLNKIAAAARQQLLDEVRLQTETGILGAQARILEGIKSAVAEGVETKYKVVVATLGDSSTSRQESRNWETFKIILPVVLTVGLGFWVFILQKSVEQKIDAQKQDLGARLVLTQEYQKRKVAVYETCAKEMSMLTQGLELLRVDPGDQKQASDSVHDLYECARNNSLYVSKEVAEELNRVRSDAITDLQVARSGSMNVGAVENDVSTAEKQMKQELLDATAPLTPVH
jgi:hypothetical protein